MPDEPYIDPPAQSRQPPVTVPGHLRLGQDAERAHPCLVGWANPALLFTGAVGSSPSWRCCQGRPKHSPLLVHPNTRLPPPDPARDQSTITGGAFDLSVADLLTHQTDTDHPEAKNEERFCAGATPSLPCMTFGQHLCWILLPVAARDLYWRSDD